jgi:hypothetical protein
VPSDKVQLVLRLPDDVVARLDAVRAQLAADGFEPPRSKVGMVALLRGLAALERDLKKG